MNFLLDLHLLHVKRPVTRRVRVPGRMTLRQLHRLVQALFGWKSMHLYEFEMRKVLYGDHEILGTDMSPHGKQIQDDSMSHLRDLLAPGLRFRYRYDFGDRWVVDVRVAQAEETPGPAAVECLDGVGAAPPEDCGGASGYANLLKGPKVAASLGFPRFDPDRFDLDTVNRRLARLFPGGRQKATAQERVPTAWDPASGPPPLEAYCLDRLNVRHQMVAALRERQGPMSLAELVGRLERAGTSLPEGELSLRKAWKRQGPIRERLDGCLELDPDHQDFERFQRHLAEAIPGPPAPAPPPPPPIPQGPVTTAELQAPAGYAVRWSDNLSLPRRLTLCLVARGGRARLEDLLADLALYGEPVERDPDKLRFPGHRSGIQLQEGALVIDPSGPEALAASEAFRKWWLPQARNLALQDSGRADRAAIREAVHRKKEEHHKWFAHATRALLRLSWHGNEVAGCLMDLPSRRIRRFAPQVRWTLEEALEGTEIVVGLDPRGVFERLDLAPEGHRFVNLTPPFRTIIVDERRIQVPLEEAVRMTIDSPLTAPEELGRLWGCGDINGVLDRLAGDLDVLHALYRYGIIHGAVRRRHDEDTDEGMEVAWNLGKEQTLWEALRARNPLQIAYRPADPLHPEASLRPFQPQDASHGRVDGIWLDTGRPGRLEVSEVAAFLPAVARSTCDGSARSPLEAAFRSRPGRQDSHPPRPPHK